MITSTLAMERRADGVFSTVEQRALIGFLCGYSSSAAWSLVFDIDRV